MPLRSFSRLEIVCSSNNPVNGIISVSFYSDNKSSISIATAKRQISNVHMVAEFISMDIELSGAEISTLPRMEVAFSPDNDSNDCLILHVWKKKEKKRLSLV